MMKKQIVCIDPRYYPLHRNATYEVLEESIDSYYIKDDDGKEGWFLKKRFTEISPPENKADFWDWSKNLEV